MCVFIMLILYADRQIYCIYTHIVANDIGKSLLRFYRLKCLYSIGTDEMPESLMLITCITSFDQSLHNFFFERLLNRTLRLIFAKSRQHRHGRMTVLSI